MGEVQHETVYFTGHVQGVGFRYTASQIAREFEVTGYVKNLADGRVQLELEGRAGEIAGYIDAVEERMHSHIRKIERTTGRRAACFKGFEIR